MALWLQLVPLALDPLPEALDLDLGDLLLLPGAQDLQQDLSSSVAVARRGPSARQGQCLPWGCCLMGLDLRSNWGSESVDFGVEDTDS